MSEFEHLYWLVDFQSCPFDLDWVYASKENETRMLEALVDSPPLENTSSQLWRPGTLPEMASHIRKSE